MWNFKAAEKWTRFHELSSKVWRENNLDSAEWREINALLPSDWGMHIAYRDFQNARIMIKHAEDSLEKHLGFKA